LKLFNVYSQTCAGSAVQVARLTGTWNVSDLTWANQPAATAAGAATSSAAYGNTGCSGRDISYDVTAISRPGRMGR
jgi:hypothetical protein